MAEAKAAGIDVTDRAAFRKWDHEDRLAWYDDFSARLEAAKQGTPMDDVEIARALLPFYNAWHTASAPRTQRASFKSNRDLERLLWSQVVKYQPLLTATDPLLVGRWIRETIGGRLDLARGVVVVDHHPPGG